MKKKIEYLIALYEKRTSSIKLNLNTNEEHLSGSEKLTCRVRINDFQEVINDLKEIIK